MEHMPSSSYSHGKALTEARPHGVPTASLVKVLLKKMKTMKKINKKHLTPCMATGITKTIMVETAIHRTIEITHRGPVCVEVILIGPSGRIRIISPIIGDPGAQDQLRAQEPLAEGHSIRQINLEDQHNANNACLYIT